jgi:peptidoglycan/xylan/chitin deacetylase (PgdA/CDA1 family)
MKPKDRVSFSALVDRPPLKLPDGARMAVWTIVNVEDWDIENPMPRQVLSPPWGQPLLPDIPNWAWHEYGMRVGFWRILAALAAAEVTPTLAINGRAIESYPRVAQAALEAGWEFMGHGYVQGPMHKVDNQREAIGKTIAAIKAFTGKAPRGWESPGLTETYETVDLLAEEGIEYIADWVIDDQPFEISTSAGPIYSIPYTLETNDITVMALQHHASDEFLKRGIAQFERLYAESAETTRIMAISLHPYISGVAHRIGYLEELYRHIMSKPDVKMWTGEKIVDWYKEAQPLASI